MMVIQVLSVMPIAAGLVAVWLVLRSYQIKAGSRILALPPQAHADGAVRVPSFLLVGLTRLGRVVLALLQQPEDPAIQLRIGLYLVVGLGLTVLQPILGLLLIVVLAVRALSRRRRHTQLFRRALIDELPEVVDLLSLAISVGMNVPMALEVVARNGDGAIATAFGQAHQRVARGDSLPEELTGLVAKLGEESRPLLTALAGSLRDGTSVLPSLERLSLQVRLERRRQAEERARKLPVRLLFPLVLCILPAFGLLSVVPLLVTGLKGLSF